MIKGPLWGCRMCGNCLLQETAFICPMECPKGLRNGPCGGSTPERCYVDKTRPCIWYKIYERSFKMGRQEMLMEVLPPTGLGKDWWRDLGGCSRAGQEDGHRKGCERACFSAQRRNDQRPGMGSSVQSVNRNGGRGIVNTMHRKIKNLSRNWNGDFKAGEFVVACEITPPLSVSTNKLTSNIDLVKALCYGHQFY